jgi:hypothetical protein
VRYNCCPECFACIFSADVEESNATAASMGRIWRKIVQFENVRHEFANVRKLLEDLNLSMPQRMVMIAFERDKFHPTSQCGRKLLRGCLETLPDNKSVEDIHLHVKNDSKRNSNRLQRAARIQDKIIHSKILEKRGIPHYAALNKHLFVRDFSAASATYGAMPHDPKRHMLSKKWSQLFKPKQWGTITEETLRLSAAAWQWFNELAVPRDRPLRVDDALFTKMVTRETGRQYVTYIYIYIYIYICKHMYIEIKFPYLPTTQPAKQPTQPTQPTQPNQPTPTHHHPCLHVYTGGGKVCLT